MRTLLVKAEKMILAVTKGPIAIGYDDEFKKVAEVFYPELLTGRKYMVEYVPATKLDNIDLPKSSKFTICLPCRCSFKVRGTDMVVDLSYKSLMYSVVFNRGLRRILDMMPDNSLVGILPYANDLGIDPEAVFANPTLAHPDLQSECAANDKQKIYPTRDEKRYVFIGNDENVELEPGLDVVYRVRFEHDQLTFIPNDFSDTRYSEPFTISIPAPFLGVISFLLKYSKETLDGAR